MSNNSYGLSRDIPEAVKRVVRQRDGFGCVVCGKAIYDYEHIDPEFIEAREHLAAGIILLCDSCHRKKGKFLSVETIKAAAKQPKCKQQGFSFEAFDVGSRFPEVVLGTFRGRQVGTLLRIKGEEIFSIGPPRAVGMPFLVNARLFDRDGRPTIEIIGNEWRTPCDNWDVEVVGPKITVRKATGDILLRLRSDPPDRLIVERLEMVHRGTHISCSEGKNLSIQTESGAGFVSSGASVIGCRIGIDVTDRGLAIGVGGGATIIDSMTLTSGVQSTLSQTRPVLSAESLETAHKLGRNDRCPCGSGRKYKHCHGSLQTEGVA